MSKVYVDNAYVEGQLFQKSTFREISQKCPYDFFESRIKLLNLLNILKYIYI